MLSHKVHNVEGPLEPSREDLAKHLPAPKNCSALPGVFEPVSKFAAWEGHAGHETGTSAETLETVESA